MAHIKYVSPAGWDFGQQPISSVKCSSRGLIGNDRREFLKTASHALADQVSQIKLAKDEVLAHAIALGAVEAWGPNRNGDGFTEKMLRQYHPTFVKFARYFNNHKNKPEQGHPHYGQIKAAAWNDEMKRVEVLLSLFATKEAADRNNGLVDDTALEKLAKNESFPVSMACVLDPAFPVLTRDRGYVGIANVQIGDYVWTKNARWRRVTQLNRRVYSGAVRTFRVNGLPMQVALTADHPMWAKVFTGSREKAAIKVKARRYFTDPLQFEREPSDWIHAEHIGIGDRFFYAPVGRYNGYGAITDTALAAILGYYLAEGSLTYNGDRACTAEFTCHMSDSLPRCLPKLVESMYPDVTVGISPKSNSACSLTVSIHSTEFAEFLRTYVGRGVQRKQIPPEIFNAEPEVKLAFLGAWLDGDGWLDKKGCHWSSSNLGLVLQGRDLLASLHIPSSIYQLDHTKCETSGYENSGMEFVLNISHLDVWNLSAWSQKASDYPTPSFSRTKPAAMRDCPDGLYAYRISAVSEDYVSEVETYNIEVEEDESYSLGGLISHNCRVPRDICSWCHNPARTRDEYCTMSKCAAGGCADNLTRIVKVGNDLHHLHVLNDDPVFFDLSRVFRPADRTAYGMRADWLTKAASDDGLFELTDLIKMSADSTAPLAVVMAQDHLPGEWTDRMNEMLKLAFALSCTEKDILDNETWLRALDSRLMPALPVHEFGAPGTTKCAAVLSALADCKVLLNLEDFAKLTQRMEQKAAADAVLPSVYQQLMHLDDLDRRIEQSPYHVEKTASAQQRLFAARFIDSNSLSFSALQKRAMLSSIRGYAAPNTKCAFEKTASVSAGASQLAYDYAIYKLSALHKIAAFDAEFPLTARISVLQNRM